jgi:ATP-binding protein involved in chromosome partitioning
VYSAFEKQHGEITVQGKQRARLENIGAFLVVGSGKGGVGKSTISVNLAVALAKRGARVGLLDGDAYGPSIPMMLGVRKRSPSKGAEAALPLAESRDLSAEKKIQPLVRYGVEIMSVGFFIGEEQSVAPMPDVLGLLIRQLLYSVNWGELDYLIVDLPPGTSEPQATLCREMQLDGALLVTTPQDIARIDTSKALAMFRMANVPVLGVVQNMDGFICPHCGNHTEIFPTSSEARISLDELTVLGRVPLDPSAVISGDKGYPVVVSMPESLVSQSFMQIAEYIEQKLRPGQNDKPLEPASQDTSATMEDESNYNERED